MRQYRQARKAAPSLLAKSPFRHVLKHRGFPQYLGERQRRQFFPLLALCRWVRAGVALLHALTNLLGERRAAQDPAPFPMGEGVLKRLGNPLFRESSIGAARIPAAALALPPASTASKLAKRVAATGEPTCSTWIGAGNQISQYRTDIDGRDREHEWGQYPGDITTWSL